MKQKPGIKQLLVAVAAATAVLANTESLHTVYADEAETSYTYKKYETQESYEEELNKEMSRVYDLLKGHFQVNNICPIPGIIQTSYRTESEVKTSAYYIPQGICETEDYILVTAYHDAKLGDTQKEEKKGWAGVVYVIDVETHELLTTLGLPQSYHNGGITCDGENVWFCGDTGNKYTEKGGQPFVQCMKYSRLQELVDRILADQSQTSGSIAEGDFSEKLYINNKTSFLDCSDGVLWVGTYINNDPQQNEGYAIGYPIKGISTKTPSLDKLNVIRINGIPSSAQGMDIDGDDLYVSSSGHGGENWVESSFISRFDISAISKGEKLVDLQGQYLKRVEVPKMNEEIIVNDTSVYMVFEACSEKFLANLPDGMKTDRILTVDKEVWE